MPTNHDHRENGDLRPADVPIRGSSWSAIERFAHSFDGYGHHGSFEACAQIGDSRRHETLTDLRTCLFFEQRRFNHFGWPPTGGELEYIYDLLDGIRRGLATGQID